MVIKFVLQRNKKDLKIKRFNENEIIYKHCIKFKKLLDISN